MTQVFLKHDDKLKLNGRASSASKVLALQVYIPELNTQNSHYFKKSGKELAHAGNQFPRITSLW